MSLVRQLAMVFKELSKDLVSEDSQQLMVTLWPQESLVLQVVGKIQEESLNKKKCMEEWEEKWMCREDFQFLKLMLKKTFFI